MSTKEKILLAFVLLFLATLFLPWLKLLNIFAASLVGLYGFFIFNSPKEKWRLLKNRKHIQWMLLFFVMVVISVFLSENFHKGLRYLDPRLPLAYFPISIGLLELRKEFKQKLLLAFACLTTAIMILCLVWGIHRSQGFTHPEFLYNDSLTEILKQQSIYISLLVNISIYIFSYHVFYTKSRFLGLMIIAILFLFAMSYLLASRNLMLVLYAFTILFGFYYILKKRKYLEGAALIMGLLLGIFMIFKFFPKTFNRFKELSYTQFDYQSMGKESHYNMEVTKDQWNGANFRMAAWRCGWEIFLTHPVIGVGIGDKKDVLMEKYREKKFEFAIQTQKNVHNNYLDILYSMGIVGLALFIMGWVALPLLSARRNNDWLSILVILTFALAWITEIYFDRSLGGMLTGFFISFLLASTEK